MKNKLLISLFAGFLAVSTAVTPAFADEPAYGNSSNDSGWYYDSTSNVQEGDPDGYVYGGGDTTGNFYAEDIEDQYNQSSDSSKNNSSSNSKKNDSSDKKKDDSSSAASAEEEKKEESSEASTEGSSEGSGEGSTEDEAVTEVHGIDNPYEGLEKDEVNTCRVTSSIEMPDGFEYNVHTLIKNNDTEEYYLIHQYAADDHIGHMYMPAGSYTVTEIAVDGDDTNAYPITITSDETFEIEDGSVYSITATFDRFDEINKEVNGEDAGEESTEGSTEDVIDEDSEASDIVPDIMPWREINHEGDGPDITYDGLANAAYNVEIKITHSGQIGEARYTLNINGTKSEEAEVPSTLNLTVPGADNTTIDTGLAVTFPAGEYRIGDTYSFSTLREWQVSTMQTGTGVAYMGGVPSQDGTFVYVVKIDEAGIPGKATYVLSRNNGETWGTETVLPTTGIITDGNVTIHLTNGAYETGDMFYADIVGVGQKDYSMYVIVAIAGVAVIAVGTLGFILVRKKAGKDKYDIV